MYKIVKNYFNSDFSNAITFSTSTTRVKLFKHHTRLQICSNFYFNRIINDWNNLPSNAVNARSIHSFKSLLNNFLIDSIFV